MERYEILKNIFTSEEFISNETSLISTRLSSLGFSQEETQNLITNIITPMCYCIYDYYQDDQIAYCSESEDYVSMFTKRLAQQLAHRIPHYIVKFNFHKIICEDTPERYDVTSRMESSSKEKGLSGSSVIQSSASTPTGVSTVTTSSQVTITKNEDSTSANVDIQDNEYASKYTSFQAKTNGVHDNDVTREGDVKRRGGLLDIINLVNNLPQTFYDLVLKDVSKHFIFLY